ncbi:MAG: phosphotransferase [Ilumatobacteraceae bacterium]
MFAAGGVVLMLPTGRRRAAAESMVRWTATTAPELFLRATGWSAARIGLLPGVVRRRVDVRSHRAAIEDPVTLHEYLAEACGVPEVDLSVAFGSERPNRKPIVRVHTPDGRTVGFAKVGWNEFTNELVTQEGRTLRQLQRFPTRRLVLPRVLHLGSWQGHAVSVTTPLVGSPTWTRPAAPNRETFRELARLGDVTEHTVSQSPRVAGYLARRSVLDADVAELVTRAVERADVLGGDRPFPHGRFHGDFTPWNVRSTGRGLIVWDWERTDDGVPVGYDVLHFHFQRALGRTGPGGSGDALVGVIRDHGTMLRELGVPDPSALGLLYGIELQYRFAGITTIGWLPGLLETLVASS